MNEPRTLGDVLQDHPVEIAPGQFVARAKDCDTHCCVSSNVRDETQIFDITDSMLEARSCVIRYELGEIKPVNVLWLPCEIAWTPACAHDLLNRDFGPILDVHIAERDQRFDLLRIMRREPDAGGVHRWVPAQSTPLGDGAIPAFIAGWINNQLRDPRMNQLVMPREFHP